MEFNENNFYTKPTDIIEIYNFVVLYFFSFEAIKMLKKLITYSTLSVFLTFHTYDLTLLKSNLTEMI